MGLRFIGLNAIDAVDSGAEIRAGPTGRWVVWFASFPGFHPGLFSIRSSATKLARRDGATREEEKRGAAHRHHAAGSEPADEPEARHQDRPDRRGAQGTGEAALSGCGVSTGGAGGGSSHPRGKRGRKDGSPSMQRPMQLYTLPVGGAKVTRGYLGSLILMLLASSLGAGQAQEPVKCEASINGYKIKTIYIMGSHYSAVVWAYKHLAEWTCLTPVLDPAKADAILELYNFGDESPRQSAESPLNVSCSSNGDTSVCTDSDGNMMTTTCDASGCGSYYGPNSAQEIGQALHAWIANASYQGEARIYTPDHKLLWRSTDQKKATLWIDKVRLGTNSPGCDGRSWSVMRDAHKYKNYRRWATEKCGIDMPPLVSIDLKLLDRQAEEKKRQALKDEMLRNAREAAAKQRQQSGGPK
jgi:hypothetical protein